MSTSPCQYFCRLNHVTKSSFLQTDLQGLHHLDIVKSPLPPSDNSPIKPRRASLMVEALMTSSGHQRWSLGGHNGFDRSIRFRQGGIKLFGTVRYAFDVDRFDIADPKKAEN